MTQGSGDRVQGKISKFEIRNSNYTLHLTPYALRFTIILIFAMIVASPVHSQEAVNLSQVEHKITVASQGRIEVSLNLYNDLGEDISLTADKC
jgi:hypothetical protein